MWYLLHFESGPPLPNHPDGPMELWYWADAEYPFDAGLLPDLVSGPHSPTDALPAPNRETGWNQ